MFRLMKNEWKKIWIPVLLTLIVVTVAACTMTATMYPDYSLTYTLDAWEVGTEYLSLLYPLFVVLPVCWNLHQERKNNFLVYVQPRVPMRKYLWAKWMVYAISAFCIITIPYILSAVTALRIDPHLDALNMGNRIFENTYSEYPVVYAVTLSVFRGLIGVLVMTMGFFLAMYCENIFVVLTGPFLYTILENFLLAILGVPQYRLVTAFDPNCLSPEVITTMSFVAGPSLLAAVIILLAIYFSKVKKEKVVAVGEIGLDYYWDKENHEKQEYWFRRQIALAREEKLPMIIHSREAAADTLRVMKEEKSEEIGGVIHCFSYSVEMAEEYLKMGFYLGIGGVVTFKNAKKIKEVVQMAPMERILLETDSPYLAPVPYRGKRNSSLYLPYVVQEIAELKGISEEEVIETTEKNAVRLFRAEE